MDTDIGDDIDDAFALGLILRSPELKVVGISTAFGDTEMRARIVDRFLAGVGATFIPVTAGVRTETENPLTQRVYGVHFAAREHPDGVAAMLAAIRAHPGEITLIAIGPLFNIGAAIDRDPVTFRKLKRVVLMGGSIEHGYNGGKRASPEASGARMEILQKQEVPEEGPRRSTTAGEWRAHLHGAAGFDSDSFGGE